MSRWIAVFATLALVTAILLCVPVRTVRYLHDSLIVAEGAYRIGQGMRVGADFSSPLGAGYLAVIALGQRILPFDPRSFTVAAAFVAFPTAAFGGWIASRRFSGRWPLAIALLCGLTPLGVFALGDCKGMALQLPFLSTYGMQYNRFLWALSAPAVLALVMPVRDRRETLEIGLCGIVLGMSAMAKINYASFALPVVAYGWFARGRPVSYLAAGIGGGILGAAVFLPFADPLGYIADVRAVAASQSPNFLLRSFFSRLARYGPYWILAFAAWRWGANRRAIPPVAFLWGYGILVTSVNYQHDGALVFPLGAVILLAAIPPERFRVFRAATLALVAWPILLELAGVGVVVASAARREASVSPPVGSRFVDRITLPSPETSDTLFGYRSVIALCRKNDRPLRVAPVAQDNNPYALLLEWPSAGGALWFDEGHTASLRTMPAFERQFASVDAVIDIRPFQEDAQPLVRRAYGARALTEFPLIIARDAPFELRTRATGPGR